MFRIKKARSELTQLENALDKINDIRNSVEVRQLQIILLTINEVNGRKSTPSQKLNLLAKKKDISIGKNISRICLETYGNNWWSFQKI